MDYASIINMLIEPTVIEGYQLSNILWDKDLRDFGLFIIQVLTLIFLIIYVWKTWEMASSTKDSAIASEKMIAEMKEARDQESAPYVVPYIKIEQHMMYFGIKNIGKTVANDIKINVDPELKCTILGNKAEDISLIKKGISSLPPGHELKTMFAVSYDYLNRPDLPMSYSVKLTYTGGIQKRPREYEQVLDLSVYNGMIPGDEKKLGDVVKELENLSKFNQKTSESLHDLDEDLAKGIWLKNPDFFLLFVHIDSSTWKSTAISKLRELKILLSEISKEYGYSFSKYTKYRIVVLASQLLVVSSNYPTGIDSEICIGLESLALEMFKFSDSLFFFLRNKTEGFDQELNKYNDIINDLIKRISV